MRLRPWLDAEVFSGKHRLMKKPERKDFTLGERAIFGGVGVFVILYGYGQNLRGHPIYTNWRGLDISAQFVMFTGAFFVVFAIFPWGRLHFLWDAGRKKRGK